jgi:hypothetical protein
MWETDCSGIRGFFGGLVHRLTTLYCKNNLKWTQPHVTQHVTFTLIVNKHLYINNPRKLTYFNSHNINLLLWTYMFPRRHINPNASLLTNISVCMNFHIAVSWIPESHTFNTQGSHNNAFGFATGWLSGIQCLITYHTWIRTLTIKEAVICYESAIFNERSSATISSFWHSPRSVSTCYQNALLTECVITYFTWILTLKSMYT